MLPPFVVIPLPDRTLLDAPPLVPEVSVTEPVWVMIGPTLRLLPAERLSEPAPTMLRVLPLPRSIVPMVVAIDTERICCSVSVFDATVWVPLIGPIVMLLLA